MPKCGRHDISYKGCLHGHSTPSRILRVEYFRKFSSFVCVHFPFSKLLACAAYPPNLLAKQRLLMDSHETGTENGTSSTPQDTVTGTPRQRHSRLPRSTSSLSERNGANVSTASTTTLPTNPQAPQARARTPTPLYSMVGTKNQLTLFSPR